MACDSNSESLDQAAQAYEKAVDAAPEWVEAHINLGTTLYQLGRMEDAREEFLRAVELEPENALAEFNLGCVLEQLGQVEGRHSSICCAPSELSAPGARGRAFESGVGL